MNCIKAWKAMLNNIEDTSEGGINLIENTEEPLPSEVHLHMMSKYLSTEDGYYALCNILSFFGEEQIKRFSEILCTKYDLAGSVRSQLKEVILNEAKKKGEDFYSEIEFFLSDFFSHDYDNLESEDDIFKNNTTRLDLMFEQMLDDAVILDTVGNVDLQDMFSKFSKEEQNNILQNIRDEDIKEFTQEAFETRLPECK